MIESYTDQIATSLPCTSFPPNFNFHDPYSFSSFFRFNNSSLLLLPQKHCRMVDDADLNIFEAERYYKETQDHKKQIKRSSSSCACASSSSSSSSSSSAAAAAAVPVSSTTKSIPAPNSTALVAVEKCDNASSVPRVSSVSSVDGSSGSNYRRSWCSRATPTASSEASWNSQSGMLSHPPGSIAVSMRNQLTTPLHGKRKKWYSRKWFFRCISCSCISNKSVQVVEDKKKYFSHQPTSTTLPLPTTMPTFDSYTHTQYCYNSQATRQMFNNMVGGKAPKHDSHHHKSSSDHEKLNMKLLVTESLSSGNPIPRVINSAGESIIETDQEINDEKTKTKLVGGNRFSSGKSLRDDGGEEAAFSFPVLLNPSNARDHEQEVVLNKKKSSTTRKAVVVGCHDQSQQDHDPPRESLEVFRPTEESIMVMLHNNNNYYLSPETTNRCWPALASTPADYEGGNCQSFSFPVSPPVGPRLMNTDDDLASDASSDLFEIESFSTHHHPPPISSMGPMYNNSISRNSVDDASSISYDTTTRRLSNSRRSVDEINIITSSSVASTEW